MHIPIILTFSVIWLMAAVLLATTNLALGIAVIMIGIGVYAAALHVARRNEQQRRREQRGAEPKSPYSHLRVEEM